MPNAAGIPTKPLRIKLTHTPDGLGIYPFLPDHGSARDIRHEPDGVLSGEYDVRSDLFDPATGKFSAALLTAMYPDTYPADVAATVAARIVG